MTYAAPQEAMSNPIQNWRTPRNIFDPLNEEFGFGIDLFADPANALLPEYFTEDRSAFSRPWHSRRFAFGNPPYSRGSVDQAIAYAERQVRVERNLPGVVLLLPLTTTKWFGHAMRNFEVQLYEGRIAFESPDDGRKPGSNFSNCLVIVRPAEDYLRGVTALRSAKTGEVTHAYYS